ncbi:MAG: HEPN domain-containing protein [Anaerolineae bacterium]|nr:HEPN domain-containing protein [Anaerolineae bacterium]
MRRETELWLRQAQADFATAKQLLDDGIYYASVFFAHQSAEKALKALWIHRKAELAPWTHNLVSLVRELGGGEALVDDAAELAPEYILTRYPTPEVALPQELYSRRSAEVHLQAAQRIVGWVREEIDKTREA